MFYVAKSLNEYADNDITDMVLEDVTELYAAFICLSSLGVGDVICADSLGSDYSGNHTKLSKILLNGNNICMVGALGHS